MCKINIRCSPAASLLPAQADRNWNDRCRYGRSEDVVIPRLREGFQVSGAKPYGESETSIQPAFIGAGRGRVDDAEAAVINAAATCEIEIDGTFLRKVHDGIQCESPGVGIT